MRFQLILPLALISGAASFRIAPGGALARAPRTRIGMPRVQGSEPQEKVIPCEQLVLPPKLRQRSLSKLTILQLSVLTELKRDEGVRSRRKLNKQCLIKMSITAMAVMFTLAKSNAAQAATPLLVSRGSVTPLIHSPLMPGIIQMAGAGGICISPRKLGRLPNKGAWYFALSLLVSAALLRAAGDGYARLFYFMVRHLGGMSKLEEKDDNIELGLPKEMDWGEYSRSLLDPIQDGRKVAMVEDGGTKLKLGAIHEDETEKLQQADKYFKDKKYKQHHHPVRVTRSKFEQTSYLNTLPINEDGGGRHHDPPRGYLDTLSDARRSTWDVYGRRLKGTRLEGEVDALKREVSEMNALMQMEQSMYRASNRALSLAVEAHAEELHHASTSGELKAFDEKLSKSEELRAFDERAREYEETIEKEVVKAKIRGGGVSGENNLSI